MQIKLACLIDITVPENATPEQIYSLIQTELSFKGNEFVIEEVDGSYDPDLVDTVVSMKEN